MSSRPKPTPPARSRAPGPAAPLFDFAVEASAAGVDAPAPTLRVSGPTPSRGRLTRDYRLTDWEQPSWMAWHACVAEDFGTRAPGVEPSGERTPAPLRPLLTRNLTPEILYGYGDPSVLRVQPPDGEAEYVLTATSNDAPNAFPILSSKDLIDWRLRGFVFAEGRTPAWTATGATLADFWAPEMHRVGEAYWLCFCARRPDRTLALGIAKAASPFGPFEVPETPLLGGGVIDPHLLVEPDGVWLYWKQDNNGLWPSLVDALAHERPDLIPALFPDETDQRTVSLIAALWPWTRQLEPMRRFCVHQTLIEAVTADLPGFRARLSATADPDTRDLVLAALRTPVHAQRLSPDGSALLGEPTLVLENDQPWEAHLIEGVWVWKHEGRYWLFYAGNDFSTPQYGIGVAVGESPLGPFHKLDGPLIRSSHDWFGPGHPSVALGPDGRAHLFLHAYRPGETGYKAFRALLEVPLRFEGERVTLG